MKKIKKDKYIIPGTMLIILGTIIFLSNVFIQKHAIGSVYTISELRDNFYDIKIGDEVNYEVNGYSNWQVIGKDDYEGTIDVVSKTNTENVILEYNHTKEYYENKLQEIANKYTDNDSAISARTVSQKDLEMFSYEGTFLTSAIDNKVIKTSTSEWEINPNHRIYIIPYTDYWTYDQISRGSVVELSKGGINRWVIASSGRYSYDYPRSWYSYDVIPETPIEIVIDSVDDDVNEKIQQIMQPISNSGIYYSSSDLLSYMPTFFNQQTEKIIFLSSCNYSKNNNKIQGNCGTLSSYENGQFGRTPDSTIYTDTSIPEEFGYRPVVTIKVKKEVTDNDKKEISNTLQVGDHVKYEAKGYKNWKVLSIDEELDTVNIISGGIVKNLTLTGKEDWDNYEDIIQKEVDEYKTGSNAIRATTPTSTDLNNLKEIDKGALSRYWLLSKNSQLTSSMSMFGGQADIINYRVDTIYLYKYDDYEMKIDSVTLYTGVNGEGETYERYVNNANKYTYTAGIRPVITLKLDSVKKLNENEIKEIESTTENQEKVLTKDQETKNKDYQESIKENESNRNKYTSSPGVKKSNNDCDDMVNKITKNIEKLLYKHSLFYKCGFYVLLIICLIETILLLVLLIPKIKNK